MLMSVVCVALSVLMSVCLSRFACVNVCVSVGLSVLMSVCLSRFVCVNVCLSV